MPMSAPAPISAESANAARVPVLMYHRVDALHARDERRLCVSPEQFDVQLSWLAAHGYRPCSLSDFRAWLDGVGMLPARSVLITFDDGYSGLHEHALPRLSARGWPAAVFVVSGLIGQRDDWTAAEFGSHSTHSLLSRVQIAEMARHGFSFHSHSRNHADLTVLGDAELQAQVRGSRQDLEDLLGAAVDAFAYPYGRMDDRVRSAVEAAGYRIAFSVRSGFNRAGADPYAVRRLDITGHDARSRFGHKVSVGTNDGSLVARLHYLAGRLGTAVYARARP